RLKDTDIVALLRTGRGVMPSFNFMPDAAKKALAQFLLSPDTVPNTHEEEPAPAAAAAARSPYVTTGYNRFLDPAGYPAIKPPWGTLNAIDLNTGDYLWKRPLGEWPEAAAGGIAPTGTENYGGPGVTASGLLFIAATKDE